jgi:ribonuclease HII
MLSPKFSQFPLEAGADEAGRGCLAGPVVCAAVMFPADLWQDNLYEQAKSLQKLLSQKLPKNELDQLIEPTINDLAYLLMHLNDSKQLNEITRNILKPIIEKYALSYSVKFISAAEVDIINVLNASLKGMQECLLDLNPSPSYIIIDGNKSLFPKKPLNNNVGNIITVENEQKLRQIPHQAIIKGDGKYLNIAAASVLAKTYRDEYMMQLHQKHPAYNWAQNKGYPTADHKNAIKTHGITVHHRKSFKLHEVGKQLSMF